MVSIIKNQLLKHLSRYTKNLSSDKINISTFRGEGELSNLQLDEDVLTDLLELPAWLRITSAWCNHVSFRVSWTKLKTVPISLCLDEVNITVETCELSTTEKRNSAGSAGIPTSSPQGKYSFIHKVVDGITIVVNTVNVRFKSPAFTSTVQMSRIRVESKTPKWLPGDLRVTRLKDQSNGQILIFKELSWQTVRIEASSTQDKTLTPLRLLTNQARCRITIKKKMSDCSILSSRLVLILDDLLWVLTDSQLKAALHFVDSLTTLIKESTHMTQKSKAQKKLASLPDYQSERAQQSSSAPGATISPAQISFNMFDVRETSYHFFSQRIDLHLCDDAGDGRSCYPDLKDGGALQISLQGFQVDYYPFHLAMTGRSHWPKYKEAAIPPALWLEQSMNAFRESLLDLSHPNRSVAHAPLERCSNNQTTNSSDYKIQTPVATSPRPIVGDYSIAGHQRTVDHLNKLMSSCVVLRIEDFTLYQVTTSGKKQMPKEFVTGDKDRYSFPAELSTVHAEFTYFYFPGDMVFPLPPNKIFVHLNPVLVNFHLDSCLWLNSFALNLHESLLRGNFMNDDAPAAPTNEPSLMYMDVKLEAIMMRVVIECPRDAPTQRDRPKAMQVQVSRLACTNIRELGASRADLAQALHSLQEGSLVFASDFPSKPDDLCIVTDRILSHVAATDRNADDASSTVSPVSASASPNLSRYALWSEPRDVWCVKIDPVWVDFMGARSVGQTKSVPFVDAVPITLWLHGRPSNQTTANRAPTSPIPAAKTSEPFVLSVANLVSSNPFVRPYQEPSAQPPKEDAPKSTTPPTDDDDKSTADLHVIAHISNLVSIQIDHYQYLFLLRLAEEMTELSTFISLDSKRIMQNKAVDKSIVFGCVIPQLEITMVMPSQTPGKESSGCDAESVVPDSASLGDDLHIANVSWQLPSDTTARPEHNTTTTAAAYPVTRFGSIETPSPITTELPAFDSLMTNGGGGISAQHTSNPNTHGHNVQIISSPVHLVPNVTKANPSSGSASGASSTTGSTSIPSAGRGRSRGSVGDTSFKEFGSSLLTMKKGFSSFMTSIDSALKTTADDASDTFSIKSDISSDSENFMVVLADDKSTDCMDVMFRLNPFTSEENPLKAQPIEEASEVCEELDTNASSPSEPSEGTSWRRRDLVSMVTFRLTTVEIIRQNQGTSSSIRLQVSALACDECGAIPWDELQTKFGARCRAWNIAPYNPESPPCVQLRMEERLEVPLTVSVIKDKKSVLDWFSTQMEIRVNGLSLALNMSTVIGLADLAEDEIIGKPLPMELLLENLRLHLAEDRPPVNITSPGSVPLDFEIGCVKIARDSSGLFHVQPFNADGTSSDHTKPNRSQSKDGRDRELLSMQLVMQQLKLDNEHMRRQLKLNEKSTESVLAQSQQEADVLKKYLSKAQQDVTILLDEKQMLLDTIRSLQKQLVSSKEHSIMADEPR